MPLIFGPTIKEGKVYRKKKKIDEDDEKTALTELQSILNAKGRRICDCEAQTHELLENCLNCGRLTCESEGPGKCFYCGSIVLNQEQRARLEQFVDISQSFVASHDSRLSQLSVPPVSQVRIIDNQLDQFAIDNKRHLREKEKAKLKENFNELQAKRYQRKLVLDIDLDNMQVGSSSQPVIDYADEMRRLRVSEPVQPITPDHHKNVDVPKKDSPAMIVSERGTSPKRRIKNEKKPEEKWRG